MEETVVVVMLKNQQTGFLEKELFAFPLPEHEEMLTNIFAVEAEGGLVIHMKLTTGEDVEDWQFNAIYDYYDDEAFSGFTVDVAEETDVFNPTWEFVFVCPDNPGELEDIVLRLLRAHQSELRTVFQAIEDKEGVYREEAGGS